MACASTYAASLLQEGWDITARKRYRYYVSQAIVRREPKAAGSIPGISAQAIEDLVTSRFLALLLPDAQKDWQEIPPAEQMRRMRRALRRVEIRTQEVDILFDKAAIDPQALKFVGERLMGDQVASGRETLTVRIPIRLKRWGGEQVILTPEGGAQASKPRLNRPPIKALARAFQWRRALETREAESAAHLARKVGCTEGYVGRLLRLAFLAPTVIEAILEGRQSKALTLSRLLYSTPTCP